MSSDQSLSHSLERLRSIAADLDSAAASQVQQIASELTRCGQQLEDERCRLEQQRQSWDAEREQAAADIQEQSRLLADAWLRLESDRRDQGAVVSTSSHPSTPSKPLVADRNQGQRPEAFTPGGEAARHSGSTSHQQDSMAPSPIEQFQLLRRESRQAEST